MSKGHPDTELQDASTLIPRPVAVSTVDGRGGGGGSLAVVHPISAMKPSICTRKFSIRSIFERQTPETADPQRQHSNVVPVACVYIYYITSYLVACTWSSFDPLSTY